MVLRINKEIIFLNIYFILLFIVYQYQISVKFSYQGFPNNPKLIFILGSFFVFFVITQIIEINQSKFKKAISKFLMIFCLAPNLVYYSYTGTLTSIIIFSIGLTLSPFLLNKPIFLKKKSLKQKDFDTLLLLIIACFLLPIILHFKLSINLNNLLLQDIYDQREQFGDNKTKLISYTLSPLALILIPLASINALSQRKIFLFCSLIFVQIYLFLVHPQKHILFSIPFIIFFYFFDFQKKIEKFSLLLAVILLVGLIEYYLNNWGFLNSLIARRSLLVPAMLNWKYFEFFSDKEWLMNSYSFLSFLKDYPYAYLPDNLIGNYGFNDYQMNANNGIISTGFMNFGFIGVSFNILFVGLFFAIVDSKQIPPQYFGIFALNIRTLLSTALSTTLISHGLLLLIVLIILYPGSGYRVYNPISIKSANKIIK